jgi:hypothetical protein
VEALATGSLAVGARRCSRAPRMARAMRFSKRTPCARSALTRAAALVLGVLCLIGGASREAAAQFTQQGSKLVASQDVGVGGNEGNSVALSSDGNTAIVGGPEYLSSGAAWVFTRSGSTWSEQQQLIGSGASGNASQGNAVAISGDGNTAAVGGWQNNSSTGAVWVFTRSGSAWTQQAMLLVSDNVGIAYLGYAYLGYSVALSSDGNTLVAGGQIDNNGIGAVWVQAV